MKRVLTGLSALVATLLIGFIGVVTIQPANLHIERSATIEASPTDVFPLVNDYQNWGKWAPWLAHEQKTATSESAAGVGAWTTWEGNQTVRKGKMTITASDQNRRVVHDLECMEPFALHGVTTISLAEVDDGTGVTWSLESQQDFTIKMMGLMIDLDALLGRDIERGLGRLAAVAEASTETPR